MSDTIQDILRRHIQSSESMRETFSRMGKFREADFQAGLIAGLTRAAEIADNLALQKDTADDGPEVEILRPHTRTKAEMESLGYRTIGRYSRFRFGMLITTYPARRQSQ